MNPLRSLLALAGCALVLAGCGATDERGRAAALEGVPRWRLARHPGPQEGTGMALSVRTPCRARVRLESTSRMPTAGAWRDLVAGQTVRLYWSSEIEAPEAVPEAPTPAQRAAGRSEGHGVILSFHFEDRVVARERLLIWTRPGRGAVHTRSLLPPGKYEPLPVDGPIELMTVAVTDLATATARLRSRELRGRLEFEGARAEDDLVEIARVFLDIELARTPPPD